VKGWRFRETCEGWRSDGRESLWQVGPPAYDRSDRRTERRDKNGRAMPGPRSWDWVGRWGADTQSGQINNFTVRRDNVTSGVRLDLRCHGCGWRVASASGGAGVERSRVVSPGGGHFPHMLVYATSDLLWSVCLTSGPDRSDLDFTGNFTPA